MGGTDRFFKVYSNLPLNIRKEVILLIEDKPITWNVAYNEVYNKTKLGDVILQKLIDLGVI